MDDNKTKTIDGLEIYDEVLVAQNNALSYRRLATTL